MNAPHNTPWYRWPGAPKAGTALCPLDDLPDPGARGFVFGSGSEQFDMFVVRKGDLIAAYVNSCPHIGTPLEFLKDKFLNDDASRIVCSTHGAEFQIDDGLCLKGPCREKSLLPIPVTLSDGRLFIAEI